MLEFDDNAHRFQVVPQSPQLSLEFGDRMFFTSLTSNLPVAQLEAGLSSGNAAFNSFLVYPAILFFAQAVVNPHMPDPTFRSNYEFGFVQGLLAYDIHMEYWGKTADLGRSIIHLSMPGQYEVDTEPSIQPWTRAAPTRAQIKKIAGKPSYKVEADFADHPMLMFPHTISQGSQQRFLRSIRFLYELRTIFCCREKSSGQFTPISTTMWQIRFDHTVSYSGNGSTRTVANLAGPPSFPRGGSPSLVSSVDRRILTMAQRGGPLLTPAVLGARLRDPTLRTVTNEDRNADFDATFWR